VRTGADPVFSTTKIQTAKEQNRMSANQTFLTAEGYKKLVEELNYLRTTGREQIAGKIKEARSFGDLSENAEYDEAMNEQAILEAKITRLEDELKNVQILGDEDVRTDVIGIGSLVKIYDKTYGEELEFQIIGKAQASPEESRVSDESPIGRALLGHVVGDLVEVETPGGPVTMEILSISK
jgi:transcription elongation factor GreA